MLDDDTLRRIRNHAREHSEHPFKAAHAGVSDFVVLFEKFESFETAMLEEALDAIDAMRSSHADCVSCSAKILAFAQLFSRHKLPERYLRYQNEYNKLTQQSERDYRGEVLLAVDTKSRAWAMDENFPGAAASNVKHMEAPMQGDAGGQHIHEEIRDLLFASSRPGYDFGANNTVPFETVASWIDKVKLLGIRSILCLLDQKQLALYSSVPGGLLQRYTLAGFQVVSVPVKDHKNPPLSAEELTRVTKEFKRLPKPLIIHCSAGVDRTGAAVQHLKHVEACSR